MRNSLNETLHACYHEQYEVMQWELIGRQPGHLCTTAMDLA